jgi:hypothetical protein
VDAAERKEILSRYIDHSRRFETVAQRRTSSRAGEVITAPLRELEQEPIAREIEVLQLISEASSTGRSATVSSSRMRR